MLTVMLSSHHLPGPLLKMINVARAPVLDTNLKIRLKYILLMVAGTAIEAIIEPRQFQILCDYIMLQ